MGERRAGLPGHLIGWAAGMAGGGQLRERDLGESFGQGGLSTTAPAVATFAPYTCVWKRRRQVCVNWRRWLPGAQASLVLIRTCSWVPRLERRCLQRFVRIGSEMAALNTGFTLIVQTRSVDSSACEGVLVPPGRASGGFTRRPSADAHTYIYIYIYCYLCIHIEGNMYGHIHVCIFIYLSL